MAERRALTNDGCWIYPGGIGVTLIDISNLVCNRVCDLQRPLKNEWYISGNMKEM